MVYRFIKEHQKLAAKRNPSYERNRFAKYVMIFIALYWAGFLLFTGSILPSIFREIAPTTEPYRIFNQFLPYLLFLDFCLRIIIPTPLSRDIKPYLLLPVSKKKVINTFLIQSGLRPYNLFFFCTFIPFSLLTVYGSYGVTSILSYFLGLWLLMVFNNYWYLLCKMLANEHTAWLLLPVCTYTTLLTINIGFEGNPIETFFGMIGEGFINCHPLSYGIVSIGIVVLFLMIQQLQIRILYSELAKTDLSQDAHISSYHFLDTFGKVGEFIKLELKLILRNKATRTQFRLGFFFMVLLSLLLAFTPVYDNDDMTRFICIYSYSVIGIMTLGKVMCYEGNYLDGLMCRKESIIYLLQAKYYLNLLILVLPLSILAFPIYKGKISLLMASGYLAFTAGFVFFLLLQLAVYNQHTISLNQTLMRNNKSNSLISTILIGAVIGVPILLDKILNSLLSPDLAYIILLFIGIFFIFTHRIWIRSIYQRYMRHRYQNMESFRATK